MSTLTPRRQTSSKLPLEICESIIGFIHLHNGWDVFDHWPRRHLCSCLLVCRDWVPKSRIELYRYVELDNKRRAIGFMEIVKAFPSLGNYVRGLRFGGPSDDKGDSDGKYNDWLYTTHQVLPSRLPSLTILEYRGLPVVHPIFFVLPSQFHSVRCLRLRFLQSWSLRETVRLLSRFTQLEELVIFSCFWGKNIPSSVYFRKPDPQYAPKPFAPHFELLKDYRDDGKGCSAVVGWLARSHLSNSLCSIKLRVDLTASESLRDLLNHCSGTLESIQLQISSLTDDFGMSWMPAVSMCRKLRTFGLHLLSLEPDQGILGQIPTPLPHLRFIESLCSLPTSLRSLSLTVSDVGSSQYVFTDDSTPEFWEALDGNLGGPKFSHLTCVELIWSTSPASDEPFVDQLYDFLCKGNFAQYTPKLYSRGILWCGEWHNALYPISEGSSALAIHDRTAWRDSSRPSLLLSSNY